MVGSEKWRPAKADDRSQVHHLLTIDNNLAFQQNFANYPIKVVVLIARDNTYATIIEFFNEIVLLLQEDFVGPKIILHPAY